MQAVYSDHTVLACCGPCSQGQNINVKNRMKAVSYQKESARVSKSCPGKMVAEANKFQRKKTEARGLLYTLPKPPWTESLQENIP